MITNYNISRPSSFARPAAISKNYDSGFTLDYFYGPYDTPDGNLTFSYTDTTTFETIVRPNADMDGQQGGTWDTDNQTPVYNSRLNYQKALAKQMLTDFNQFFVGKKVCFIDDEGNPVEYFVVPDPENEGELHFEDASSLSSEVYRVLFNVIPNSGASGSQAPVEVGFNYYTLPVCKFTPPTDPTPVNGASIPMLFLGWRFGYTNGGEVVLQGDTYDAGEAVNLKDIVNTYSSYGVTNDNITFYATYTTNVSVDVDFENGFYDENDNFQSIDTGSGRGYGYIQVQDGSAADNEKPLDWDVAWSSYFVTNNNNTVLEPVASNNYELYKSRDLYVRVIRDSYAMFNNGEIIGGTVEYDNLASVHNDQALQYASIQLNSEIIPPYNSAYVFDHWEITAYGYQPNDVRKHWIEDYLLNIPFVNAWFKLDAKYSYQQQGVPVTQEAAGYKFRAVYRKREGYFAKMRIETNYMELNGSEGPKGTITIVGDYKTVTNTLVENAEIATVDYDGHYYNGNCPGVNVINPQEGTPYLEIDPSIVLNVTLQAAVIEPALFYVWSKDDDDKRLTPYEPTASEIEIRQGIDYRYKAWFVFANDITAKVRVNKRLSSPTGQNVFSQYNGSSVGIYGYKYANIYSGGTLAPEEVNQDIPNVPYLYVDVAEEANAPSQQTIGGGSVEIGTAVAINNKPYPITFTETTLAEYQSHGATQSEIEDPWRPRQIGMVIDESNELDNPVLLPIMQTGHNYCFIKASVGDNDGAPFLYWSDGNTNPVRLVDVTLPKLYTFTAVFQAQPIALPAQIEERQVAELAISDIENNDDDDNNNVFPFSSDIALSRIEANMVEFNSTNDNNDNSVFINIPGIGHHLNPLSNSEFNNTLNFIRETAPNVSEIADVTTTVYDYQGNQYQTTVEVVSGDVEVSK